MASVVRTVIGEFTALWNSENNVIRNHNPATAAVAIKLVSTKQLEGPNGQGLLHYV